MELHFENVTNVSTVRPVVLPPVSEAEQDEAPAAAHTAALRPLPRSPAQHMLSVCLFGVVLIDQVGDFCEWLPSYLA